MSTGRRILVHGLLAAVPSAIIGLMLASLAGLYLDANTPVRTDRPAASTATDALHWRLPAAMAAFGFLFVAVGEGLMSLWRTPAALPPKVDFDKLAEEQIQALLRAAERNPADPGPAVHKVG